MNTLTYNGTTLDLPDDLAWPDEFAWSPVVQQVAPSITGALIVDIGVRAAGRPIELAGARDRAWMPRATAEQLQAWAAVPGAQMTLMLRGTTRTVIWDHERGAFSAEPLELEDYSDPLPTDRVIPRLRFLEA